MTTRARCWLRRELPARALLTLGALLPYWRFLTFSVIYVTDDRFVSDIFNGEFPARVIVGQLLRHGQWPVWTSQLCSGAPLSGVALDPIALGSFALLPPAPALDLQVVALLLISAHGAYALTRRFGADRVGAVLAGLAFAGSGYVAEHLKHLGILSTVTWLPTGLLLLDRAFGPALVDDNERGAKEPAHERSRASGDVSVALFGLVFGIQILADFPQSAYICALVYAAFVVFRSTVAWRRGVSWRALLPLASKIAFATVLGAGMGAVALLPLGRLGALSDRAEPLGWAWSTMIPYWPGNFITFLSPYFNGDISNNSYVGRSLFWEDYGYVGLAPAILALTCVLAQRRRPLVLFLASVTAVCYLLVMGPFTPVFWLAYHTIPGLKLFRFPTRFLIVVELGIAVLGGLGLTLFRQDLARRASPRSKRPFLVAVAICAATAGDLLFHQPRQNPVVPAGQWLTPPATVDLARSVSAEPRTFSPGRFTIHEHVFLDAPGWSNVAPYFRLRDLLEPNAGGGFWNVPSADCYSGITARWSVDTWGDHNRDGILVRTLVHQDYDRRTIRFDPAFATVMKTYGVTSVVTGFPAFGTTLPLVGRTARAYVYRVDGAARVRVVATAQRVATDEAAAARLVDPNFDPNRLVLLHDAPESVDAWSRAALDGSSGPGRAEIGHEDPTNVDVETDAPVDAFLLLADSYYPGWTATVDGRPAPIYRANISTRAIELPAGHHLVRFAYEAPAFLIGLRITLAATCLLILWWAVAMITFRRLRR